MNCNPLTGPRRPEHTPGELSLVRRRQQSATVGRQTASSRRARRAGGTIVAILLHCWLDVESSRAHLEEAAPAPESLASSAAPHVLQVNPWHTASSDNNPGSPELPLATIRRAMGIASPGDTILLAAGTYAAPPKADAVVELARGGAPGKPITVAAAPGAKVTIDATSSKIGIKVVNVADVVIRGLEIRGGTRAGVFIKDSPRVTVVENLITAVRDPASVNHVSPAVACYGTSDNCTISGNTIHDCALGIVVRNEGGRPIHGGVVERNHIFDIHWFDREGKYHDKNADGVVLNTVEGGIVRQNLIYRCGDDGIDVYASRDCSITENICFNIGDRVSGSPPEARGDGNGIKVSTGGGGGHRIIGNVCLNNERAGFDQDHVESAAPGNHYCSNVAYGNGRNGFIIGGGSSTPTVLRASLSAANGHAGEQYADIRVVRDAPYAGSHNWIKDGRAPTGERDRPSWDPQLTSGLPRRERRSNPSPCAVVVRAMRISRLPLRTGWLHFVRECKRQAPIARSTVSLSRSPIIVSRLTPPAR